ncbi:tetratricopeptide repeat protein [Escherichia coli]
MAACATLHSCQPELALSDLTRSINIAPSANAYVARATIYRQRHNVPAAVSDLRAALELEPKNSNIQAALGYALWDSGDIAQSREVLNRRIKGFRTIGTDPTTGLREPASG